ncbi:MAG: hypothetical protein ACK56I_26790, partial [bacterium]
SGGRNLPRRQFVAANTDLLKALIPAILIVFTNAVPRFFHHPQKKCENIDQVRTTQHELRCDAGTITGFKRNDISSPEPYGITRPHHGLELSGFPQ